MKQYRRPLVKVVDQPDGSHAIGLHYPIVTTSGAKIGELTLRRPTVDQWRKAIAAGAGGDQHAVDVELAAQVSGIPTADIGRMDYAQFLQVVEVAIRPLSDSSPPPAASTESTTPSETSPTPSTGDPTSSSD